MAIDPQVWAPSAREGYYLNCRPTDQLFDILPFEPIAGKELVLNAVDASSLETYATAVPGGTGGSIDQNMPSTVETTFELRRIAAEVPLDGDVASGIFNSPDHSLVEALLSVKVNAVRDKFKHLLIEGDSTTSGEFDGLAKLCDDYSQTMYTSGPDGNTVAKGEMEELLSMVKPRAIDGSTFFVMHSKVFTHLLKNNYDYVEYSGHPTLGSVPAIAGVPVIIDEFGSLTETRGTSSNTASAYCVRTGKGVGLTGIVAASDEDQPIQVRGPVVKEGSDKLWFHVSWNVAIAIWVKCAIARLAGILFGN